MTDWTKTCYVTGKTMSDEDDARFTYEFDAWVSVEGQKIVEEAARGSNPDAESLIIFREWYAQDAEADANYNNNHFRKNHK
jgi:hypothetical protein